MLHKMDLELEQLLIRDAARERMNYIQLDVQYEAAEELTVS